MRRASALSGRARGSRERARRQMPAASEGKLSGKRGVERRGARDQHLEGVALVRGHAGEDLVEDGPEQVHVRARREGARVAEQHLRREVGGSGEARGVPREGEAARVIEQADGDAESTR